MCRVQPVPLQGSGVHHGPILNNVHNDLLKRTHVSSVQTMAQTDPITHRLASNPQASTSRNYKADLAGDLANMFQTKFIVDIGRSHLHQKPYPNDFDLVSYPVGWCVPDFIKFNGDDNRTT